MADLLKQDEANPPIKMICMADSGGGKTGALCSLAAAGYRLRILDSDLGTDIIRNLLLAPTSPYKPPPGGYDVQVIKVSEKMKKVGPTMVPASAQAWDTCLDKLERWKDGDSNLGNVFDWGEDTVLVLDTLSTLSNFAMNKVLALNSRFGQQPYQSDWGEAQRYIEAVLQTLYAKELKCHVIVNCHLVYIGEKDVERGYPNTLGKALSPRVGRYFNHALLIQGGKIRTKTTGLVDLKSSSPLSVKDSYPLDFGLADYFKAVRGSHPKRIEKTEEKANG